MRERRRAAGCVVAAAVAALAAAPGPPPPSPAAPAPWRLLEPGLDLGEFPSGRVDVDGAPLGDDPIRVLRIDPERFELRLLNASAEADGARRSARDWCVRHDLAAAINASMYQTDLLTSVSLMRSAGHVNNPRVSRDKAVLAFDRRDAGVPRVQIIDRECQDFEALRARYGTLVQSIRMVSCAGRNVWSPQPRAFSTAAIGVDGRGRVLFILARAPYSTRDLIDALLALPLDLRGAMYVEGGSEAQLAVRAGGEDLEFVGLPSGAAASGSRTRPPQRARPLPNVVGVARRRADGR